MMSQQNTSGDTSVTRLSYDAFEGLTWTFYAIAVVMAIARTTFRVHTFRKVDLDDMFLILATLCLTGGIVLVHMLYPYMLIQNKVTVNLYTPGRDFPAQMLRAKTFQSAAANLTNFAIYAVKFSYLVFFRKLLQRQEKFMIWWWIVFGFVAIGGSVTIILDWTICTDFSLNFLVIVYREHIWLITTTVLDVISDALIISIPAMILWNVKIPLKAKFGVAGALCLSLCMMMIAILRVSLGSLIPGVTDTIWTYFSFGLEASTAVFMVSATAFRSTYGHRNKSTMNASYNTPLASVSKPGPGEKHSHGRPLISSPKPVNWYDKDDACTKTIYQPEVEERTERTRDIV